MSSINWRLVVSGINHKTSSLKEREPLGFSHEELAGANAAFSDLPEVIESCIISTCNRTEFYFVTKLKIDSFNIVRSFYSKHRQVDISSLENNFYIKRNSHVADHLFRVAGGLDSMVLGENQILAQVREAYSSACAVKAAGKVIHRLFHQAFRIGKQIRSDTEMGKGACSVSSASVDLLRSNVNGMKNPSVLFIGVNQMIALAASNLSKEQYKEFVFANRTKEKAVTLAERYDAHGYGLDELPQLLTQADMVVTCTGANEPIISSAMLNQVVREQSEKKLLIMDMAIPRDVEVTNGEYKNVSIFDLEDVRKYLKEHQQRREAAIPQAELIVERRLSEFVYWFDHVRHELLSTTIEESFDNLRRQELAPIVEKLSPELQNELETATRSLVQKLLRVTARTCSKCSDSE